MTIADIELRLATIEKELARLKAERSGKTPNANQWWEKIHGTMEDDAAFREAMAIGKKWRESQRPPTHRKAKAKRK